jgi:hypothetical protein
MWPFSKRPHSVSPLPDSPFAADFTVIRDSLQKLRNTKSAKAVFGAGSHGFSLNPTLDQAILARFESAHGVRLPEDYCTFLLHLGNGGAGPGHGLFKFLEMDDGHKACEWRENEGLIGTLSQPFPHADAWNDQAGRPDVGDFENLTEAEEDARQAVLDAWEAEHYWNRRQVNGAIPICHLGCALRQWLVITGDEAGHVWNDFRADERGIFPLQIGSNRRVTFLEWYQSWLEDALEHATGSA